MRHFFKIFVRFLLLVGVLLVIATVWLRVSYPPERIQKLLEERVSQEIHRTIQVNTIQLSALGATFNDVRLSEKPDFSQGTFLTLKQLRLTWELLPLLDHKIILENLVLQNPEIHLVRQSNGKTWNFTNLPSTALKPVTQTTASTSPGPKTGQQVNISIGGKALFLELRKIRIAKGTIHFDDRSPARQSATLKNVDITLSIPTPVRAQGNTLIGSIENSMYTAQDLSVEWMLKDRDFSWSHPSGWVHLKQGPARFSRPSEKERTPTPFWQKLDRLGLIHLGLPDFRYLAIHSLQGDFQLSEGIVTLRRFNASTTQFAASAIGSFQIPRGPMALEVDLDSSEKNLMEGFHLTMHIAGMLDNPNIAIDSLKKKAFKATIKNYLKKPGTAVKDIDKAIQKIFK